jgi:hypothetical protein
MIIVHRPGSHSATASLLDFVVIKVDQLDRRVL